MTSHVARIAVALLLLAPGARADTLEREALAHLDRGVAAFRAGDYAGARGAFTEASRLAPDRPNPYRWLALAEAALGDCRAALVDAEAFLSRVPADDPRVPEIAGLRTRCAGLGTVDVVSRPAGATVRVDGAAVATTPARGLALRVGVHDVAVEKPGFAAASHAVEVRPTGTALASFDLVATPPPLIRRWWFWVAVGAAAATAAGATYALTRGGGETRVPPVFCDAMGCRP
jgi:hypothetical protein